jgi:hypothetical protein
VTLLVKCQELTGGDTQCARTSRQLRKEVHLNASELDRIILAVGTVASAGKQIAVRLETAGHQVDLYNIWNGKDA